MCLSIKTIVLPILILCNLISTPKAFDEPSDILAIRPFRNTTCTKVISGDLNDPTKSNGKIGITYIAHGMRNKFDEHNWFFLVITSKTEMTFKRMAMQIQLNDEAGTVVGHFSQKIPCLQRGHSDDPMLSRDAYEDYEEFNEVPIIDPESGINELESPRVAVFSLKFNKNADQDDMIKRISLAMMIPKHIVERLHSAAENEKKGDDPLGFFVTLTVVDAKDVCYFNQVSQLHLLPPEPPEPFYDMKTPFPWDRCPINEDVSPTPRYIKETHPLVFQAVPSTTDTAKITAYKKLIDGYRKKTDTELQAISTKNFTDDLPEVFLKEIEYLRQEVVDIVAIRPNRTVITTCDYKEGVIKDPSKSLVLMSAYYTPYEDWYNVKLELADKKLIKLAMIQINDGKTGEVVGKFTNEFPCKPLAGQENISLNLPDLKEQLQNVFENITFVPYSLLKGHKKIDPTIVNATVRSPGANSFTITVRLDNSKLFFIAATVISGENSCMHNQVSPVYDASKNPFTVIAAGDHNNPFAYDCDAKDAEIKPSAGKEEPSPSSNPLTRKIHKKKKELDMGPAEMNDPLKSDVDEFNLYNHILITTTSDPTSFSDNTINTTSESSTSVGPTNATTEITVAPTNATTETTTAAPTNATTEKTTVASDNATAETTTAIPINTTIQTITAAPTNTTTEIPIAGPTNVTTDITAADQANVVTDITTADPANVTTDITTADRTNTTTEITITAPTNATTDITTADPANVTTDITTETPTNATLEITTVAPTNATTEITTAAPTNATTEITTASPTNATTETPTNATIQTTTATPTNATTEITTAAPTNATTEKTTAAPTNATTETPTNATTEIITASPTNATPQTTTASPTNATTQTTTAAPTNATTEITTVAPTNATTEITTASPTNATTQTTTAPTNATTETPTNATTEITTVAPANATTEITTAAPTNATTETTTAAPTNATTETPTNATTETPTNATTEITTVAPTNATTEITTAASTNATTEITIASPTIATTQTTTAAPTNATTETPTNATTEINTVAPTNATTEITTASPTNPTTEITTAAPTNATTQTMTAAPTDSSIPATIIPPTDLTTPVTTVAPTDSTTPTTKVAQTSATEQTTTVPSTDASTQTTKDPTTVVGPIIPGPMHINIESAIVIIKPSPINETYVTTAEPTTSIVASSTITEPITSVPVDSSTLSELEQITSVPVESSTLSESEQITSLPVDSSTLSESEQITSVPVDSSTLSESEQITSVPVDSSTLLQPISSVPVGLTNTPVHHETTEHKAGLSNSERVYIECEITEECIGEPDGCIPLRSCVSIASYAKEDNITYTIYIMPKNRGR